MWASEFGRQQLQHFRGGQLLGAPPAAALAHGGYAKTGTSQLTVKDCR